TSTPIQIERGIESTSLLAGLLFDRRATAAAAVGVASCGARAGHRKRRALEAVAARGWRHQRVTWRRGRR
nr:hypothetical protein [Candidatus Sigynarchaeum springense]